MRTESDLKAFCFAFLCAASMVMASPYLCFTGYIGMKYRPSHIDFSLFKRRDEGLCFSSQPF